MPVILYCIVYIDVFYEFNNAFLLISRVSVWFSVTLKFWTAIRNLPKQNTITLHPTQFFYQVGEAVPASGVGSPSGRLSSGTPVMVPTLEPGDSDQPSRTWVIRLIYPNQILIHHIIMWIILHIQQKIGRKAFLLSSRLLRSSVSCNFDNCFNLMSCPLIMAKLHRVSWILFIMILWTIIHVKIKPQRWYNELRDFIEIRSQCDATKRYCGNSFGKMICGIKNSPTQKMCFQISPLLSVSWWFSGQRVSFGEWSRKCREF